MFRRHDTKMLERDKTMVVFTNTSNFSFLSSNLETIETE